MQMVCLMFMITVPEQKGTDGRVVTSSYWVSETAQVNVSLMSWCLRLESHQCVLVL